jgi:uncharacterized protein (DUF362 family)
MDRRLFLKSSLIAAWGFALGGLSGKGRAASGGADIAVVEGSDPARQVRAAVDALGGIKRFVKAGERVVLLPNPQWRARGASTNPAIALEVAKLCREAGAASVILTTTYGAGAWGGKTVRDFEELGVKVLSPEYPADYVTLKVPGGRVRKEVTVIRQAVEGAALINIPVFKHHVYAGISGSIKNIMGINHDNISFHQGEEYLQQAIADLASAVPVRLCVVDATTILADRGPGGPGRVVHPNKVYAGTDMAALDETCCALLEVKPGNVGHIAALRKAVPSAPAKNHIKNIRL